MEGGRVPLLLLLLGAVGLIVGAAHPGVVDSSPSAVVLLQGDKTSLHLLVGPVLSHVHINRWSFSFL